VYLITAYCEAGYLQVILTGIVQSSQDLLHMEAHMFLLAHINTLLKPFTADIQFYLHQSGLPELANALGQFQSPLACKQASQAAFGLSIEESDCGESMHCSA
jgi:hypothetical protein